MTNLLACGHLVVAVASRLLAGEGIPPCKIITKRDNDRVAVKFEGDKKITVEWIDLYRN